MEEEQQQQQAALTVPPPLSPTHLPFKKKRTDEKDWNAVRISRLPSTAYARAPQLDC